MDNYFLNLFNNVTQIDDFLHGKELTVDERRGLSLLLAVAYKKSPQQILVVVPSLYQAQDLYESLENFLGQDEVYYLATDEVLRLDAYGVSKEMLEERVFALAQSLNKKPKIIVTNAAEFTKPLMSPTRYNEYVFNFEVGQRVDIKELKRKLLIAGYVETLRIEHPFEFSIRGDIIDIYSINYDYPLRIELFDIEIESIRFFKIETQRSTDVVSSVTILPANDLIVDADDFLIGEKRIIEELQKMKNQLGASIYDNLLNKVTLDLSVIREEGVSEKFYRYYKYFITVEPSYLSSYFKDYKLVVFDKEGIKSNVNRLRFEAQNYYRELYQNGSFIGIQEIYRPFELTEFKDISYLENSLHSIHHNEFKVLPVDRPDANLVTSYDYVMNLFYQGKNVLICLDEERYVSFKAYLHDKNDAFELFTGNLNVTPSLIKLPLTEGFEIPELKIVVLTHREIFGIVNRKSRFLSRYKDAKIIKDYEELNPGDYIVHENYGIGIYVGIKHLESDGTSRDYLEVHYAGTDIYYVPVANFKLIRKYMTKEGKVPVLDSFGGTRWAKTKLRIASKVNDLADKLLEIEGSRKERRGYSFEKDDEFQKEFEVRFPYSLTIDQERAVREIKADMEKEQPMDRLLSGDVGFGKTEVAFRAAFKAINSGYQVALLCPTTLLARQHFEVAMKRFDGFGIKIALFSRFVAPRIQDSNIELIKEGKIHLVIGTHRLLSMGIEYKKLGLLIVDEEQRFGVAQKEKIKERFTKVDVLTLTATPIPRTMQLSLLGLRSLSQINIAPLNRMPIQTYVSTYNLDLIKEVVERELSRKGQIYYLHNRVSSLYTKAMELQKLFPKTRVAVVHGQMEADESDEIMEEFYDGKIDILVCTTIIEIGIDCPNVNTLIIENADYFGLSSLYQIKGRIGRSNRLAYAYLLYSEDKELTEASKKRLKAIKDFTELGSGYKIASRDLSIRGAGDILGAEQAGFIDTIGIEMYLKLLQEVIDKKKGIASDKVEAPKRELFFRDDTYLPSDYIKDQEKLYVYQEIMNLNNLEGVADYHLKLRDIYGKIPEPVLNLLEKRELEIKLSSKLFETFSETIHVFEFKLSSEFSSANEIGIKLFQGLGSLLGKVSINYTHQQLILTLRKDESAFADLLSIVNLLIKLNEEVENEKRA